MNCDKCEDLGYVDDQILGCDIAVKFCDCDSGKIVALGGPVPCPDVPTRKPGTIDVDPYTIAGRFDEIIEGLGDDPGEEIDSSYDLAAAYFGSPQGAEILDDLCFNVEERFAGPVRELLKERFPILSEG